MSKARRVLAGHAIVLGLLVLACWIGLVVVIEHPGVHVGGLWWFLGGSVLGVLASGAVTLYALSPFRWRVFVKQSYGEAEVRIGRLLGGSVRVAKLNPETEDFENKLHEAMAVARQRAAALEVASR